MKKFLMVLFMLGVSVPIYAEQFWPAQVGEKYVYKRTSPFPYSKEWKVVLEVYDQETIGPFSYVALKAWNYDNDGKWEDWGYIRSTGSELFDYNPSGDDYLQHKIAPVGTEWTFYQEDDSGLNYKVIEVVEIGPVTVPYGHFDQAYKTSRFRCKDPNDWSKGRTPYWYEWIVPGVGWVKQEDYLVNGPPPFIMELVSVIRPGSLLVYNEKSSDKEIVYDDSQGEWEDDSDAGKAYIVVQPGDNHTANALSVDIWKGKDDKGKPQKYYVTGTIGTFELIMAPVGKKTLWIMVAGDDQHRILLTGKEETKIVNGEQVRVATTLKGRAIWDDTDGDNRYIGTGRLSWRLNTKVTNAVATEGIMDADDAVDYIVGELIDQNYIESD